MHSGVPAALVRPKSSQRVSDILPPTDVLKALPESALSGFACECAGSGFIDGLRALAESGIDINVGTPYDKRTPLHLAAATGNLETVRFLVEDCGATMQRDRFGLLPIHDAVESGHADIRRYLQGQQLPEEKETLTPLDGRSIQELMGIVFELIVKEGIFSYSTVHAEVHRFFVELDLHPIYFDQFTPYQIAKHVHCLMAAKRVAMTTDDMGRMAFVLRSDGSGFFLSTIRSPLPTQAQQRTEEKVASFIAGHGDERGQFDTALIYMASDGPVFPSRDERLGIWAADRVVFEARRDQIREGETSLELLGSSRFLKTKSRPVREQYLLIMEDVVSTRRAVVRIVPESVYLGRGNGGFVLMFGTSDTVGRHYFPEICHAMRFVGLSPRRFYMEPFLNGVIVYSLFFPTAKEVDVKRLQRTIVHSSLLDVSPGGPAMVYQTVMAARISHEMGLYLLAAVKFVYAFFPKEQYAREYTQLHSVLQKDLVSQRNLESLYKLCMKELLSLERIYELVHRHLLPGLAAELFADFRRIAIGEAPPRYNHELDALIERQCSDQHDRQILCMFLTFNASIRLTNFFKPDCPMALAFRLDPAIIFKGRLPSPYPEVPFGLYLVVNQDFCGFHVRFRNISRGGIRIIVSQCQESYDRNFATLFDECYSLALTQQNKNKDIPEGGSKGVILPNSTLLCSQRAEVAMKSCFLRYFDALLDCMLPGKSGIFAGHMHGSEELLFFGPDENTAGFMDYGCELGRARGYPFWKALTTGKSVRFGGVPHDKYGMTTSSVHTFVTELLKELGEDEKRITKIQTGGPDGDLGSNEILMSNDRTLAIVDVSGVVYDPCGLDRAELSRLAHARLPVKHFSRAFLGHGSFLVTVDETDVELPDGSKWRSGLELRDTFHLTSFAAADLFVPCGGRPNAVTMDNVKCLFHADGRPKFRMVVEGANLFLSDDAMLVLEDAGVHVFKDASTNKGGVTSSSLEVFAALALPSDDHTELMTYNPEIASVLPQFYVRYVEEILHIVRSNAQLEFWAIWKLARDGGQHKVDATRRLSSEINVKTDNIVAQLGLMVPEERSCLIQNVLKMAVPPVLLERVGTEGIMRRVPEDYIFSMVACWIASRYVYQYGCSASDVSFFFFMRSLVPARDSRSG
eukprot:TRINITY_DN37229_c0_g1_i1.p1 TRINITY_DN37229_c0_g1~~TRINITY_DN37229_c0_g1_i1.p1  ORF type:complete len:1141 (-),score=172.66 TRINITY_DN37229_c0_g1_i1:118-3540(-)